MNIKMPLKFLGSYKVITRKEGMEKQELCQKLSMTPIKESDKTGEEGSPTHLISYFCFGCKRLIEGRIKENSEDRVVFQVDEREIEFSLSTRGC